MNRRIPIAAFVLLTAGFASTPARAAAPVKKASPSARLLLPFFQVDTTDPLGASTFFSVRNEGSQPIDVEIRYFETGRPSNPERSDPIQLAEHQLKSIDIRSISGLLVDGDGFARGFVLVEALTEGALIQGEYFQITPGQGFATGARLVNVDPASAANDLCSVFTIRFLNGGGFDGGTVLTIWLDSEVAPDGSLPVFDFTVYRESGEKVFNSSYYADQVAFQVAVEDLVSAIPTAFGALTIELTPPALGHVAATLSALGLYSVGFEAACSD